MSDFIPSIASFCPGACSQSPGSSSFRTGLEQREPQIHRPGDFWRGDNTSWCSGHLCREHARPGLYDNSGVCMPFGQEGLGGCNCCCASRHPFGCLRPIRSLPIAGFRWGSCTDLAIRGSRPARFAVGIVGVFAVNLVCQGLLSATGRLFSL